MKIQRSEIYTLLFFMTLIVGIGATIFGFSQMTWPVVSKITLKAFLPGIIFVVVGILIIEPISQWLKMERLSIGALIMGLIAIFTGMAGPLLVTIWFFVASYCLGISILIFLKTDKSKLSGIMPMLMGAGIYGTAVGIMAHFPINYPGLYGLALTIPILCHWRFIIARIRNLVQPVFKPGESKWLEIFIVMIALMHFIVSLMPEVGADALCMHLFIPVHIAHRHQWGFDASTYVWAVMPMLGDWIFSIGYMLGGETAARLINVGFIFALGWLIRDLVLWAGGNALGARWAVLLFLSTPLTFTESSTLFIEAIWSSFAVAGIYSILQSVASINDLNDQKMYLILSGLLMGLALASKAVTFIVLPICLFILAIKYKTWCRQSLFRSLCLGSICFLFIGMIPYVTAWHLTGNPVFPFFNKIFQSPLYPAVNFDSSSIFGKGLVWDVLYQVTFHTGKFLESTPGGSGFQWLLLFVPTVLLLLYEKRIRGIVLFLVASLFVFLAFQSVTYLRYVFPAFVIVAAGIGIILSGNLKNIPSILIPKMLLILAWIVIGLNIMFFKSGTNYGHLSWQPLMSTRGREAYMQERMPLRSAIEMVNRLNLKKTPVAFFAAPLTAGLKMDGLYPSWYNYSFYEIVEQANTSEAIAALLLNKGVDYIILDENWELGRKNASLIKSATKQIAAFGSITVRSLK